MFHKFKTEVLDLKSFISLITQVIERVIVRKAFVHLNL